MVILPHFGVKHYIEGERSHILAERRGVQTFGRLRIYLSTHLMPTYDINFSGPKQNKLNVFVVLANKSILITKIIIDGNTLIRTVILG